MAQFSYTEGTSEYMDFLIRFSKVPFLPDNDPNKDLIEKALEMPGEEILVIKPMVNISIFGFSRIMEHQGGCCKKCNKMENKPFYFTESKGSIFIVPNLYIPWQTFLDAIKEIDKISYLDPNQKL